MLIKVIKVMLFASTLLLMGLTPNPDQGREIAGRRDKQSLKSINTKEKSLQRNLKVENSQDLDLDRN